jgi:hypothetical protein
MNRYPARERLVKPAPVTYDVFPASPTDWDERAHDQWMVPTVGTEADLPPDSRAARDLWGSYVPSAVSAPAAREFASDPLSSRGTSGVLSTSVRVFGFLTMVLAVLVVVLDCLMNNQKSSVFAAGVVGGVFTVGVFLAAPRR